MVNFRGRWTFDTETEKIPTEKHQTLSANSDEYYEEAKTYVNNYFSDHIGTLTESPFILRLLSQQLQQFLKPFLNLRLRRCNFKRKFTLNHSVDTNVKCWSNRA